MSLSRRRTIRALPVLALSAFLLVPLAACSSQGQTSGGTPTTAVQVAAGITRVDPKTAQSLIDQGADVIDVRTPSEFAAGHLAGAVNVDVESAGFTQQLASLDPARPTVVYCHSGNRSAVAVQQMATAGFRQLYDVDGGILAWQSDGLPVTAS